MRAENLEKARLRAEKNAAETRRVKACCRNVVELLDPVQNLVTQVVAHLDGVPLTSLSVLGNAKDSGSFPRGRRVSIEDEPESISKACGEMTAQVVALNDRLASAVASSIEDDCIMQ